MDQKPIRYDIVREESKYLLINMDVPEHPKAAMGLWGLAVKPNGTVVTKMRSRGATRFITPADAVDGLYRYAKQEKLRVESLLPKEAYPFGTPDARVYSSFRLVPFMDRPLKPKDVYEAVAMVEDL